MSVIELERYAAMLNLLRLLPRIRFRHIQSQRFYERFVF